MRLNGTVWARSWVFLALVVLSSAGGPVSAATDSTPEQLLLRMEVEEGKGDEKETVSISAPLVLLDSIWDCLPKECQEQLEASGVRREELMQDLTKTQTKELVRVEEENETVRIWLEPVSEENREALNFLKIHVLNTDEEVNICLPKGLVQLGIFVSGKFGVLDQDATSCLTVTTRDKRTRE